MSILHTIGALITGLTISITGLLGIHHRVQLPPAPTASNTQTQSAVLLPAVNGDVSSSTNDASGIPQSSIRPSISKKSGGNDKIPTPQSTPPASVPVPASVPLCTADTWRCRDWGICSSDGNQIRSCSKTTSCEGGAPAPATWQSCAYVLPPPLPQQHAVNSSTQDTNNQSQIPLPQETRQQEDPALKIARCQAEAQVKKDRFLFFGSMMKPDAIYGDLLEQKNLLLKHLYDSPLNADELAKLNPALREEIGMGNRSAIEMQVRLINDDIAGRKNQLAKSLDTFAEQSYNSNYLECLNH